MNLVKTAESELYCVILAIFIRLNIDRIVWLENHDTNYSEKLGIHMNI